MFFLGNYSFYAEASPLLYSVLENATKSVSCPDPDFSHDTVFHQWRKRFLEPNEEGGLRCVFEGRILAGTILSVLLSSETILPSALEDVG